MVMNKDGSWYVYLDYRQLKKITIKDQFTIPIIDELQKADFIYKVLSSFEISSNQNEVGGHSQNVL
jgi:hypothetical protein